MLLKITVALATSQEEIYDKLGQHYIHKMQPMSFHMSGTAFDLCRSNVASDRQSPELVPVFISLNSTALNFKLNKYDRTMGPGTRRSLKGFSFV